MKFYAQPNHTVFDVSKKKHYFFNDIGEFETDNEYLIKKMKRKFKYKEATDSVSVAFKFNCKKCDYGTDNLGYFGNHMKEHKKVGE